MDRYIILIVLLCDCGAQQIYDFNVTITTSIRSWSDVIEGSDCDVLGIGLPTNVSLSDVYVDVHGMPEESEFWIGSSVIYTPWIKIEHRLDRDLRRGKNRVKPSTIKRCFYKCNTSFYFESLVSSCECGELPDNQTLPARPGIFIADLVIEINRGYVVFEPVDIPQDSSYGNCKTVSFSDGNVSLLTTPCSSCKSGVVLPKRYFHPFSIFRSDTFIFFDDYLSDELRTAMEIRNITSVCVAAFRYQTFQWYNKDRHEDNPLHCLSAVVTNGSLSPRVRHCDTKLPALCVVRTTRVVYDDDTTCKCAYQSFHDGLIVGAISEVLVAIAMVIVFVVCMFRNKKKSIRSKRESQTSGQDRLYSSLDQADRAPPHVYGVVDAPNHYNNLDQADRAPPSAYAEVISKKHVYDGASQNRTDYSY